MKTLSYDDLPDSLREMVDVIGLEAVIRLVEHFGGIRVRIPSDPRRIHEGHPLARAVGIEAARKLGEAYAGLEITVPRAAAALRALRNQEIHRLHTEEGWPAHRLARKYQLHEYTIYTILSAYRPADDSQGTLF